MVGLPEETTGGSTPSRLDGRLPPGSPPMAGWPTSAGIVGGASWSPAATGGKLPLAAKGAVMDLDADSLTASERARPAELERRRPWARLEADEPRGCISGVRTRRGNEASMGLGGAEDVCLTSFAAAVIAAETAATWAAAL